MIRLSRHWNKRSKLQWILQQRLMVEQHFNVWDTLPETDRAHGDTRLHLHWKSCFTSFSACIVLNANVVFLYLYVIVVFPTSCTSCSRGSYTDPIHFIGILHNYSGFNRCYALINLHNIHDGLQEDPYTTCYEVPDSKLISCPNFTWLSASVVSHLCLFLLMDEEWSEMQA